VATVGVVTAYGKLAVSVRPGSRGMLLERGSICDDIVAFSQGNYGNEDGVAS